MREHVGRSNRGISGNNKFGASEHCWSKRKVHQIKDTGHPRHETRRCFLNPAHHYRFVHTRSPFSSTVNTHNLSMAETNEHDATYQEHDRRLQGPSHRCLTRRFLPAIPNIFWILPSREAPIARC